MKKIFSVCMLLVLCFSMFAGCGQKEKEKKQVELIIKTPPISMDAANDSEVTETIQFLQKAADAFAEQYEDAEVTFRIEEFEYVREDEAIPGSFDTEDAADVLYEGYFNMGTYIHTGRIVPLDDIISDRLHADISDSIWEMSTVEGKTYMMPYMTLQNVMVYNKDLFRECGLEQYIGEDDTITNWTIEEWEYILDTLSEKLPDGCYPIMMYSGNDQGDTHIMTFIRSHGSTVFDENNYFNIDTEEGIAGLQWIADGVERGWYPPKCENLEISDCTTLFGNGQLALTLSNNVSINNFDDIDCGCVNFPSVSGDGYATSFVTGFEVFDNGDADKLAAAKAFVQYVCETDEWAAYSTGGLPVRSSVAEKYADYIYMLSEFDANRANVVDFTRNNPNWRGVRDVFYPHIHDLLTGQASAEDVAAALDADCNAAIEEGRSKSILHE